MTESIQPLEPAFEPERTPEQEAQDLRDYMRLEDSWDYLGMEGYRLGPTFEEKYGYPDPRLKQRAEDEQGTSLDGPDNQSGKQ